MYFWSLEWPLAARVETKPPEATERKFCSFFSIIRTCSPAVLYVAHRAQQSSSDKLPG